MLCKFLMLLFAILIKICFGNETCLSSENQKWNAKKSSCVECRSCDRGWFRNLSQEYYGPTVVHGHTRCLPCNKCPKGTYSNGYSNGCALCQNCVSLYREYDQVCTGEEDAHCGSCIRGYNDAYKSTKMPCVPETRLEGTQKPTLAENSQPTVDSSISGSNKQESKVENQAQRRGTEDIPSLALEDDNGDGRKKNNAETQESFMVSTPGIILFAAVTVVSVSVFVGVSVAYVRPSWISRQRRSTEPLAPRASDSGCDNVSASLIPDTCRLGCENDIEVDADSKSTDKKLIPFDSCEVRAELETSGAAEPRGELTDPVTEQVSEHKVIFCLSDGGDIYFLPCTSSYKFCQCKLVANCNCKDLISNCPNVSVSKSDRYIITVAERVCHNPTKLFRRLKLGNADIYQENNTRDRNPVEITEKELVTTLLNIWTQKQANSRLRDLLESLCYADFHCICQEISSRYFSLCKETTNVKYVDKTSDKSIEENSSMSVEYNKVRTSDENAEHSETSLFLYDPSINSSLSK